MGNNTQLFETSEQNKTIHILSIRCQLPIANHLQLTLTTEKSEKNYLLKLTMTGIFFNSFSFVWGLHIISEDLGELYEEEEQFLKRELTLPSDSFPHTIL